MNRLGLHKPTELQGDQKAFYDQMAANSAQVPPNKIITQLADGTYVGPFGVLLHHPPVGRAFLALNRALTQLLGLSQRAKEVAILRTGAKFQAAYELYAHAELGRMAGLPEEVVAAVRRGVRPEGLDEECSVAFDVAAELVERQGPLSKEAWERAERLWGRETTAGLVHLVAFYAYVCVLLNGFDVVVPESKL